jgi:NAD(P)H-hydrate epimerase
VLKGARTVIAAPDGELCVNPTGGPSLAAGGSGDVLAGLLGALLAQGLRSWDAARVGTYLHGLAGALGPRLGGLASELAARIPAAWHALASGCDEPDESGTFVPFP